MKKIIVDFRNHTVTIITSETCGFHEAGLFYNDSEAKEPNDYDEFVEGDYDNYLYDNGYDEIDYIHAPGKWIVNKCDQDGNIITGYEEIMEGTQDECEADYRHHHEYEGCVDFKKYQENL